MDTGAEATEAGREELAMVLLRFHHDETLVTAPFWWIDSPHVPGFHVSAPTIVAARDCALDTLRRTGFAGDCRYEIVDQGGPLASG
jgi:hypothetical protein